MILSVTLNPSVDHTLYIDGLRLHDTNRVTKVECDAGGKGVNLSRMVVELGTPSTATGFVGGRSGAIVSHSLDEQGVTNEMVRVRHETRSVYSIESGDGPPTTFNEPGQTISDHAWHELLHRLKVLAQKHRWVALGGSLPTGLPKDAYLTLARLARDAGARVLIDADGQAMVEALKFQPDLVKPNQAEAERLLNRELRTTTAITGAAVEIWEKIGGGESTAIISCGSKGAAVANGAGAEWYPAFEVEAKSSIGSGDSMLAGYLVGEVRGLDQNDSMRLALAAGAATAMSDGSRIGTKTQVDELLARTQ